MNPHHKKLISIVVPVFNEASNIQRFHDRVSAVLEPLLSQYDFEFVFTDNHSTDDTFSLLNALAQRDPRVRVCRFSKNFGYQNSILMGYALAKGAAAVQLDGDLQDPPELMGEFLAKWEKGYRVVYGVRRSRQEFFLMGWIRKAFYRVINSLSDDYLPPDAGDFRLLDRRIIDELVSTYDASPYLRGFIASLGFPQIGIPYDREARVAGESKFSFTSLVRLAVDGILSHSLVPLKISFILGAIVLATSVLLAFVYLFAKLFLNPAWPPGFATLALLILASTSVNLLFIGVLGAYVGRIFLQVKHKPNVIVQQAINLSREANRFPFPAESAESKH